MTSRTSKNTRPAPRRAGKTTERPITASERDEAVRTLLDAGQLNSVRNMHFCDSDRNMPIAGTPRPKPCPFCGKGDSISVVIEDELKDHEGKAYTRVHVDCGVCGAESPAALSSVEADSSTYGLVLAAVRYWQCRGGVQWGRAR